MRKWVTRDGTKLWPEEMTDSHLINAYRYFSRIPDPPHGFQGEMAEYFADMEWHQACLAREARVDFLRKEMERRGLIK